MRGVIRWMVCASLAVVSLLAGCAAATSPPQAEVAAVAEFQTLIALRDPASNPADPQTVSALTATAQVTVRFLRRTSGRESVFVLLVRNEREYALALQRLRSSALVEFVEEDERMRPQSR